ncbi:MULTISPECIES: bacteriocin immunity protein [unclassified Pseudomonas]|uniref:bacteriocin immunity protein n=1 Tax=unclassified Pseudomonas TaxID=196821 RepID=UPI000C19FB13|nr:MULTISPECIES: bacteriocin immunity protein [unclassified Pseudomonas]MBS3186863.1 bacteriocin immunity protein [Pseudomonas sp. PCH44]PIK75570.1 colicin immunity protein [Pseudomonas sp. 382]
MVISQKHSLADYTCAEFRGVVDELLQATGTSAWQDQLLEHFIDMAEHPDGSDLLYYTANELEGCAVGVIARIIAWRKSKGLPLFKDVQ